MTNSRRFRERMDIGDLVIVVSKEPVKYDQHLVTVYDKRDFNTAPGISVENLRNKHSYLSDSIFITTTSIDMTALNDDYFFEDLLLDIIDYQVVMTGDTKAPRALIRKIMTERGLK